MKYNVFIFLICFLQYNVAFSAKTSDLFKKIELKSNRSIIGSNSSVDGKLIAFYALIVHNSTADDFRAVTQNCQLVNNLLSDCEFNRLSDNGIVTQSSTSRNISYTVLYGYKEESDAFAASTYWR